MHKETKHIGFKALAKHVEKEYISKGYSKEEAKEIGQGTAANVYRRQRK